MTGFRNSNTAEKIVGDACEVGHSRNFDQQGFIVGPRGPIGETGPKGEQGDPGGPIGPAGPPGPPGDASSVPGPQGPQGERGVQGPPTELDMDAIDTFANRVNYDNEPADFLFLDSDEGAVYIKLSDASGDWSIGYPLADGPQGPQGPTGNTGGDGTKGEQGEEGIQGVIGPQGPIGVGIQGPVGPQGPQGATGADGARGVDGIQGPTGATGATGATGPAGTTYENVVNIAAATGSQVLDLSGNNYYVLTLTGNITISFIGAALTTRTYGALIRIKQNGSSPFTVTWPANARKHRGIAISQTTTLNGVDIYTVVTDDAGTNYWLNQVGQNYS